MVGDTAAKRAALDADVEALVLTATGAHAVAGAERLQTLWSGYGELLRVTLQGGRHASVIVKQVRFPDTVDHPRGWHGARGDARKRRSYAVEAAFYDTRARRHAGAWRCPAPLAIERDPDAPCLVLEDLGADYPILPRIATLDQVRLALDWLAAFHAEHLGSSADALWPNGTYWNLDTRPDELATMADGPHRTRAGALHDALHRARFRTLVHGDAKLANFLFGADGGSVAAVDYQYTGGGPGVRDVAYLLGSCLDVARLERSADGLLDHYDAALQRALERDRPAVDADAVVAEWRGLYPVAWADFDRFLLGWAPDHPKLNRYGEALAREAFARL